jgi:ferredoxin-NADP reductase
MYTYYGYHFGGMYLIWWFVWLVLLFIGNNKLIFANKTKKDIILENEFKKLLGNIFINILSDEKVQGYANGQITKDFIQANRGGINKLFYLCGPSPMMEAIEKQLADLQVDEKLIVKEAF